jgi:hypothetical protein
MQMIFLQALNCHAYLGLVTKFICPYAHSFGQHRCITPLYKNSSVDTLSKCAALFVLFAGNTTVFSGKCLLILQQIQNFC